MVGTTLQVRALALAAIRKEAQRLELAVDRISPTDEKDRTALGILSVTGPRRSAIFYVFSQSTYVVKIEGDVAEDAEFKSDKKAMEVIRWAASE